MLYSRYANPSELMRLYIEQGRFGELVNDIIVSENKRRSDASKEMEEKTLWEYWLHRVYEMSYQDYRNTLNNINSTDVAPSVDLEKAVAESAQILNNFTP